MKAKNSLVSKTNGLSLGVKHDYYIGGFSAHDFMTWRHLLYFQFLPNLWK